MRKTRDRRGFIVRLGVGAGVATGMFFASASARAESILNLTSTGTSSGTINGAIFQRSSVQPTGSGVIDAFLRIDGGNNKPFVQGYNTDARSYKNNGTYVGDNAPGSSKTQFDEKSDLQHTHIVKSVALSTLSQFTIGGTSYYGFLLDIGQQGNSPSTNLSMRALQIFQSASARLDKFVKNASESLGGSLTGAAMVYDMDAPAQGDYRVDLQANLNPPGNGVGDMTVFIPAANFNALENVYLYSSFGTATPVTGTSPYANGGSFQEWATLRSSGGGDNGVVPVPLPAAAWAGIVLIGAIGVKRFFNGAREAE